MLYADAPGVVTAIGAEPGEVVTPGRMVVQIARDEGHGRRHRRARRHRRRRSPPDPEITVALSQNPAVTAQGRIREVAPRADAVTGTFRVRVGLIDPPAEMRLGSTVTGHDHASTRSAASRFPASALTAADGAAGGLGGGPRDA